MLKKALTSFTFLVSFLSCYGQANFLEAKLGFLSVDHIIPSLNANRLGASLIHQPEKAPFQISFGANLEFYKFKPFALTLPTELNFIMGKKVFGILGVGIFTGALLRPKDRFDNVVLENRLLLGGLANLGFGYEINDTFTFHLKTKILKSLVANVYQVRYSPGGAEYKKYYSSSLALLQFSIQKRI